MEKNLKNYYKVIVSKTGTYIPKRHIHHPGGPEENPEADEQSHWNRNTKSSAITGMGTTDLQHPHKDKWTSTKSSHLLWKLTQNGPQT